jgi:hypothetical protein
MTLMKELHAILPVHINKPNFLCKVHEDNQSTIRMATSDKFTPRTKHVALKYHHFCSHVKMDILKLNTVQLKTERQICLQSFSRCSIFQTQTHAHCLVICSWHRPSVTRECGISLLLDSHLANIWRFLLKICQTRILQNSICSGNSRKIPFAQDLNSTRTHQESCHEFGAILNGTIQKTQSRNLAW